MQPPPPYEMMGGPPRKKNSALPWLIVGGVLICCVGPIALIGGGGLFAARQGIPLAECGITFSTLGSALRKYAAANGGKLPNAKTWQTDIATYYDGALPGKDETGPISIPRGNEPLRCDANAKTGIAFNVAYSGKVLADIKDPEAILVYETTQAPALNLSGPYKDPGKAASPKVFGNLRGWFALNAGLNDVFVVDGRQTPSGFSGGRRSRRGSNE